MKKLFPYAAALLLAMFIAQPPIVQAQGTMFTYQGKLNVGASPANGAYNLTFTLFNTNVTGTVFAGPVTNAAVLVSNGLFITTIDLGANAFSGANRWLEIAVQTNGGAGFTTLTPRQQLTPTPYAITACNLASVAANNTVQTAVFAAVGGGAQNTATNSYATVGGGVSNSATGNSAFVGGGNNDAANGDDSVVAGGNNNTAGGNWAAIGGGQGNYDTGDYSVIGGGQINTASGNWEVIGGGQHNSASGVMATVGGGHDNTASGYGAVVAGGGDDGANPLGNFAYGDASFIGGGVDNIADQNYVAISGGLANYSSGLLSFIGGGYENTSTGDFSALGGGQSNTNSGRWATVPGGRGNSAAGDYSFAAGLRAKAKHPGSFVWADSTSFGLDDSFYGTNSFNILASGGVLIINGVDTNGIYTSAIKLDPGASSWATVSDQNQKKNFAPVNGENVLARLAAVPVEQWNYKWEKDGATPNIGPMAQAFKAAFYPGRDDKSITTLEFDGVELAAIQGLNEKIENEKQKAETQMGKLAAENAALKQSLAELKQLVQTLVEKK